MTSLIYHICVQLYSWWIFLCTQSKIILFATRGFPNLFYCVILGKMLVEGGVCLVGWSVIIKNRSAVDLHRCVLSVSSAFLIPFSVWPVSSLSSVNTRTTLTERKWVGSFHHIIVQHDTGDMGVVVLAGAVTVSVVLVRGEGRGECQVCSHDL